MNKHYQTMDPEPITLPNIADVIQPTYLSWWQELEQKARGLMPQGDGATGKLSVIVVHGYSEGQDLSGLVGENMICVTCKATTKIGKVRDNCEKLYREAGTLHQWQGFDLFCQREPNPIDPAVLVLDLNPVNGVVLILAKVAPIEQRNQAPVPICPSSSDPPNGLNHEVQNPDIKPDPFTWVTDPPAFDNIPPFYSAMPGSGAAPPFPTDAGNLHNPSVKREYANEVVSNNPHIAPKNPVRNVDLSKLFNNASLEVLEEGVKKGTDTIDSLQNAVAPHPETAQGDVKMWFDQLQHLKNQTFSPKTIIGVVGNTGAGKSSVINALLDEERLVPTNCMRACTAVVTEISYNYETEDPYRAAIEFIEWSDWERELRTLFDDLREGGDLRNKDSEAGVALAKIRAVYPGYTKDDFLKATPEALLEKPGPVKALLGTTKQIVETESLRFYRKLQRYVDSNEKTEKVKPGEKRPPKEMEYWPLIKVVKLYVKSQVLSTGAVVVDLPGSHDANAARATVAEGYMKNCTGLWIVAPITRAVDDKTAHTLLGQTFRRQLLMDGGFSSVSFICSKSDDISITEAILSLKLEDELEEENATLERLEERMQELKDKKTHLFQTKKVYQSAQNDISDQLEIWEELKEKVEDGKEVFEPKPKPSKLDQEANKKRKRGARAVEQKDKIKRARVDSREMDDFIAFTDEDTSEIEEIDSDSEKENSQNANIEQQPLTEEEIDNKLTELKGKKKNTRLEVREITNQISDVQDEFTQVKAEHTTLRNKIATFCIKARNSYSTEAIKQDFAAGLQELDMEAAEKADAANFDPTKQVRDYNEVADQLPVFCVSSRGYQKLQGRLKRDGDPPVFSNIEETGLPELQNYCMKLTEKAREHGARKFLNSLSLMINSLYLWAVQASGGTGLGIDDCVFRTLEQVLDDIVSNTAKELKGVLKGNLYGQFSVGVDEAAKQAIPTSHMWARPLSEGGWHWATYKAVCRRDGAHSGVRGPIDFNADLSNPLIRMIAGEWERTFARLIPEVMHSYLQKFVTSIEKFHLQIGDQAKEAGKGVALLGILQQQLGMYEQNARQVAEEALNQIQNAQRDINREFGPVVMNAMLPGYIYCVNERGTGSYMRMKMGMINHVSQNHQIMFNQATTHVQERLNQLVRMTEQKLEEATQGLFQIVRRDYKLLGGDTALGHTPKFHQEKRALRGVLRGVENDFRQVLGLEKLEELDGLDELPMDDEPKMDPVEMERVMRQLGQLPPEVPQPPEAPQLPEALQHHWRYHHEDSEDDMGTEYEDSDHWNSEGYYDDEPYE